MRRLVLLVLGAAIAGALVVYLRRRGETADVVFGPEAREQESAATEDTRFDRHAEEERQRRREAATRVQDHPLGRRAEVESEEA